MGGGLLGVSLGAGMLAAVNPCGFALLPAYVSLLLTADGSPGRGRAVMRALGITAAMTAGFAGVFALFGLAIAPVASSVQRHLPWFTVSLGVVLVLMGVWMLSGRSVSVPRVALRRSGASRPAPLARTFTSMAGFGASYAVASLSCTIAPFLAVVIAGFRSDVLDGVALFLAYAAGMGLVVGTLAIATALASHRVVTGLRQAGRWTPRVAGALLAGAGAYVAYYGAWELRVLGGGEAEDPVIDTAATIQQSMVRVVDTVGPAGWLALGGLLLMVTGVLVLGQRRSARARLTSGRRNLTPAEPT
ncbi:MAG: cytochrome c biogenesis CcdA family protein [Nocardioides sp.]